MHGFGNCACAGLQGRNGKGAGEVLGVPTGVPKWVRRASSSVAASYLYGYLYVYQYSYHEYRYQSTLVPVGLYAVPVILVRYEYRFYCTAVQRYRYYIIDLRTTAFYTSPRRQHP